MTKIPKPFLQAMNQFQNPNGEYARALDNAESALYSAAKLARQPGLRFRRDIPPFLGAGTLHGDPDVVVTFGMNPKRVVDKPVPTTPEEYFQAALDAFNSGVPSSHHRRFLELLGGILGRRWRSNWQNHYATFDMLPWYSDKWAVSRLTKKRADWIRPQLEVCADLLGSMSPRLAVFNGRLWRDVLQLDPPLFASTFRERTRVEYASVVPQSRGGVALIGDICLTGTHPVPAVVLTWFIHQARPPFSFSGLKLLGEKIRAKSRGYTL